jgi:hypothetical protein
MTFRRFVLPSLTAIVFAAAALVADAQTGPVGGPKTTKSGPQSGPQQGPVASKGLTPERVASMFQAQGAQTAIKSGEINQIKFTAVNVKLKTADFNYDFNVVFLTYTNGAKNWYCTADLNPNASNLTVAQLQGVLKSNCQAAGATVFMIDNQANILMLETGRYDVTLNDTVFNQLVTNYLNTVKNTSDVWYTPAQ